MDLGVFIIYYYFLIENIIAFDEWKYCFVVHVVRFK